MTFATISRLSDSLRVFRVLLLGVATSLSAQQPPPLTTEIVNAADVVMLPPFIVDHGKTAKVWYYLSTPDLEILSAGSDLVAPEFARNYHRQEQVLRQLIPDRFLWKSSLPQILLLVDDQDGAVVSDAALTEFFSANRAPSLQGRIVQRTPNLRLVDRDRTAVFATHSFESRPEYRFDQVFTTPAFSQHDIQLLEQRNRLYLVFTADRIAFLLNTRAPLLPAWFRSGFIDLYAGSIIGEDHVDLGFATWRSNAVAEAFRLDSDYPRELMPLPAFFAARPNELAPIQRQLWRRQAALMVRWALWADDGIHRENLWSYFDRTELTGRTERSFERCFGFDYAEARDRLSDFLNEALFTVASVELAAPEPPPTYAQRRATPLEVARMRGEWERLEVGYVSLHHPDLVSSYLGRARATLASALQTLGQDPELRATTGLLEYDAGDRELAREHLEAAVAQGVVRPRALHVLAQLRYDTVRERLPADRLLSSEEIGPLLVLLRAAMERDPPLPEIYALLGRIWMESELPPSPLDLNHLLAGVRHFPEQPAVVTRTAIVLATQGHLDRALMIVEHGMDYALDEPARQTYRSLRQRLEGARNVGR